MNENRINVVMVALICLLVLAGMNALCRTDQYPVVDQPPQTIDRPEPQPLKPEDADPRTKPKVCPCNCPNCIDAPGCPCADPKCTCNNVVFADFNKALKVARAKTLPLAIVFRQPGCPPCDRFEQNVVHSVEVQQTMGRQFILVTVDVIAHEAIANRYGVRSTPTIYVRRCTPTGEDETGRKIPTPATPADFLEAMQPPKVRMVEPTRKGWLR